jgi:hypothetical protein
MSTTITEPQAAFLAGAIWLDARISRPPSDAELAVIADRLCPDGDSLAIARECVDIAPTVAWVQACRARKVRR